MYQRPSINLENPAPLPGRPRPGQLVPSPLYYMGDECLPSENVCSAVGVQDPDTGWFLTCDKLRLVFVVLSRELDPHERAGLVGDFTPWRPSRRRGSHSVSVRRFWFGDGAVMVEQRRFDGVFTHETIVEFNPDRTTEAGALILDRVWDAFHLTRTCPTVDRVDVAWDALESPYLFRLDPGRFNLDYYGVQRGGAETEYVGRRRGAKTKVRKYNKGLERRRNGLTAVPDYLRFEVETWEGAASRPSHDPRPERDRLQLTELADLRCPIPEGVGLVELVRPPGEFADGRYLALGCVAMNYGPAAARSAARDILGSTRVDQAAYVLWDDRLPRLLGIYRRCWARVAERVRQLAFGRLDLRVG